MVILFIQRLECILRIGITYISTNRIAFIFMLLLMVLFFVKSETAEHFVQKAHKDYTLQNAACPFITLKNLNGIIQTHTHKHTNYRKVIIFLTLYMNWSFENLFMVDQNVIVHAHINIVYSTMNKYKSISALLQNFKE